MSVAMIGPKFYGFGSDGKPLAFGKLYTYQARTNTPKDTYQSEDQVVPNTNPVILNGEGYANVYLDGSYKVVLKDADENEIWSADPVSASSAEEWDNCLPATYVSATTFKVNGNFTAEYDANRRVRVNNNTSNFSYSTIISSSYAANETTVVLAEPVVLTGVIYVCASIIGENSGFSKQDLGRYTDYVFETIEAMIANADELLFEVGVPLKVQGENDVYTNYIVVGSASDVDLGGGLWAKKVISSTETPVRQRLSRPSDLSGLLSNDGYNVVITGDSLSYNKYDYVSGAVADAYSCPHGIRSWPFLLRDLIHMNDMGFVYGDAVNPVISGSITYTTNLPLWQLGFNNRASLINVSDASAEFSFKASDINITTGKFVLHLARIPGKPCQFDVYVDDGVSDSLAVTVDLPAATNYEGYDPVIIDVPYTIQATAPNFLPKITFKNWLGAGGIAFPGTAGVALMAVGTKSTPVYMTGHGGWQTGNIAADYQARIGDFNPDVLICIAGANDRTLGNISSYEAGYRSIIEQTQADNPECIIVLMGAMPATDPGYVPESAEKDGESMFDFLNVPKILADELGCIFIDNYRMMLNNYQNFLFDNVHLNRAGNTRLFRQLVSSIMPGNIGYPEHLDGASTYGDITTIPIRAMEQHQTQAQVRPRGQSILSVNAGVWTHNSTDEKFQIIKDLSIPVDGRLTIECNYPWDVGLPNPFGLMAVLEQYGSGNKAIIMRELTRTSSAITYVFVDPSTGNLFTTADLNGNNFKINFFS